MMRPHHPSFLLPAVVGAAFLCRTDLVDLFLERGAALISRSERGESPVDVVSSPWSDDLAGFYTVLSEAGNLGLDLESIRKLRPRVAELLRDHKTEQ
jgi:hypothetical protein